MHAYDLKKILRSSHYDLCLTRAKVLSKLQSVSCAECTFSLLVFFVMNKKYFCSQSFLCSGLDTRSRSFGVG